jgi:predicted phosphate transport protein (TIGR00153 family)
LFGSKGDTFFYQTLIDVTANIVEAIRLFRENVKTLEKKEEYSEQIKALESKGDEYTQLLITELNKAYYTPMDREDILQLAGKLDDVLDGVESCATRIVYIDKPTNYLIQFGDLLEPLGKHLQDAFICLQKQDFTTLRKLCVEINMLEDEGDRLMRESVGSLFNPPVEVVELIKMKDIYERLERVTDAAEDIANILEGMIIKYG